MAAIHAAELPWHEGEDEMHKIFGVPRMHNPTSQALTYSSAYRVQQCPLLAIGTLDKENRPWSSLWGGEEAMARAIGKSTIGVNTLVDNRYDPVVESLMERKSRKGVSSSSGKGAMIGGLSIDLETRDRVKLFGWMADDAIDVSGDESGEEKFGLLRMAINIVQSLGEYLMSIKP
jgi:hypothetical protein